MRTREKIVDDAQRLPSGYDGATAKYAMLSLEVLLDIRELLSKDS